MPMRIVICAAFYPPYRGGYAESVRLLAEGLAARGAFVTVIACDAIGTPCVEIINGVTVRRVPAWNPPFLQESFPIPNPFIFLSKLRLARTEGISVISTQTRFFPSTIIGFMFGKLCHIPLVHTERGAACTESDSMLIRACGAVVDYTAGWLICRFSDSVIGVSDAATAFAHSLGARSPVTVHNGIDADWWRRPDGYMRGDSFFRITFVGRLVHAKGVHDLIAAVKPLLFEFPAVRLSIVGDGPYREALEARVSSLDIDDAVRFHRTLDSGGIRDILWQSDVFVNPSHSEGFPRSVLEAAAVGLPIIATDVGGTREIIKDTVNGILIKKKNPMALMKTLRYCICDTSLAARMGKAASISAQYFSVARMTENYEKNFVAHAIL